MKYLEAMRAMLEEGKRVARKGWQDEPRSEPLYREVVLSTSVPDEEYESFYCFPSTLKNAYSVPRRLGHKEVYELFWRDGDMYKQLSSYMCGNKDMLADDWYIVENNAQ